GSPVDEYRPLPETQGVGSGQGAPCGLGDVGFASLRCAPGFSCTQVEDPEIGTCLSERALGAPCEYGKLSAGSAPQRGQVSIAKHACPEGQQCTTNFSGFPQGACTASCKSAAPGGACADYLDVDAFQNCLRGKDDYATCAERHVFGAGVQACDEQR